MDPAGWISEERRLPKLPCSKTFTLGYLPETALSSEFLDIVVLMFVYSWYRWALSRTNANLLKKNCSRTRVRDMGVGGCVVI